MSPAHGPEPTDMRSSSGQGLEVVSLLFEGAPTRVYRARTADGRQVVLKSLGDDGDPLAGPAGIQHEFDMARALRNEHVVQVHGLELGHERISLVLEDFGGASLDRILAERPLPVEEVLEIGIQVASGLAAIHSASIIHKDINPSNIVYNPHTRVAKIIDFGISSYLTREQADMGSPATLEGSLPYVSPEQTGRMNRALDYRTDFYSLGATLYELLARRPLFDVEEPIEWLHCHIAREPLPLHQVAAVPRMVSDIVARLLAKSADDRYRTAAGIRTDLERCLDELRDRGEVQPFALAAADRPDRFQIRQHLYGREEEIQRLMASFERASTGTAELMLVHGYSGIGKTCLVKELYRPITSQRGFFVSGKFDQLHRNVPLSALASALRDLVRQLLTESEEALGVWRGRLLDALAGNGRLMTDLIPDLTLVLGEQQTLVSLSGQAAETRFRRTLMSFIGTFAQSDHPLVIFLDDLQWADAATLTLLELLLTDSSLQHLLVIGAYRDNEVHAAHPLMLTTARIREAAAVDELALQPLRHDHLAWLLADSLHTATDHVAELAELVERKTAGNPYFTEEFLKDLYRRELIRYDTGHGCWTWDTSAITAEQMTDNVLDLMSEKLRRLSPAAREMLQIAACIGHRLELDMLLAVYGRGWKALASALREAMSHGLIAPLGPYCQLLGLEEHPGGLAQRVELAFAHDRIQQAAHELLDETQRRQTHLRIGRMLIGHLSRNDHEEHLFRITDHLNTARELITSAEQRRELSAWNRAAGARACAATAYHAAARYYAIAVTLVDDGAWSEDAADVLALYAEAADAACMSAQYGDCDRLLTQALTRAPEAGTAGHIHLIQMKSLIAQGLHTQALDVGRSLLRRLGFRYPRRFIGAHLAWEYLRLRRRLRGLSLEDLHALPEAETPVLAEAYAIGQQMALAAHIADPRMLVLVTLRGVKRALDYGIDERSIVPFGGLGVQLCLYRGAMDDGEKYSRFARELCDRFPDTTAGGRIDLHHYAYLAPWREPLRDTAAPLVSAYESCLAASDFDGAAQALNYAGSYAMASGRPLAEVRKDLEGWRKALAALNQREAATYMDMLCQAAANLLDEATDAASLNGAMYDIDTMLPEHQRVHAMRLILAARARQGILLSIFGRHDEAREHLNAVRPMLRPIERVFDGLYLHFHDALVRLGLARRCSGRERRKLLRQVKRSRRLTRLWARHIPANAAARHQLVEAEWHYTRGNQHQAQRLYDKAIASAREHRLPNDEGLANHRAAQMHLQAGRRTIAEAYLAKARDAYQRWGAIAVVRHLEAQYPVLRKQPAPAPHGNTLKSATSDARLTALDVTALTKSLKAIAQERVHSRMVRTIIDTALEFAGAQRGLLMLRGDDGKLRIEAESSVDGGEAQILQSLDVEDSRAVSPAVVNYVTRTRRGVVIHDAQQPGGPIPALDLDRHVREQRVGSILCLPLTAPGENDPELIGLLYLENNRASHAFTEQRFDTLEIICLAAAGRLELSRKAAVDGLTGLFNRDHFQTMFHQELLASQRHQRTLSLILADIDHFKQFNDTWGHQLGDEVLRAVAAALRQACRESDVVARYGGEELAVILPDTEAAGAQALAERVRCAVEALEIRHQGQSLTVTVSLGVASAIPGAVTDEDLLRRADAALYQAKRAGRNQVRAG